MNATDIKNLFERAETIKANKGINEDEAMNEAMVVANLVDMLREGVVSFSYRKKDGSIRKAVGTLRIGGEYLGAQVDGNSPSKTVAYWDCQKGGMRSFKVENLISFARA